MSAKKKGFNEYEIRGDIGVIFCTNKKGESFEIKVDAKHIEELKDLNLRWFVSWYEDIQNYYACATQYIGMTEKGGRGRTIMLHRIIMDASKEYVVDHINQTDTLDNTESNLRIALRKDNSTHRKSANKNNTSGYRNVCWDKKSERWIIQLQVNGKNKTFGWLKDVHEAGKLAEELREKYYGEFKGND